MRVTICRLHCFRSVSIKGSPHLTKGNPHGGAPGLGKRASDQNGLTTSTNGLYLRRVDQTLVSGSCAQTTLQRRFGANAPGETLPDLKTFMISFDPQALPAGPTG